MFYVKVSERARQSSIIDLYIPLCTYVYMSENNLNTVTRPTDKYPCEIYRKQIDEY